MTSLVSSLSNGNQAAHIEPGHGADGDLALHDGLESLDLGRRRGGEYRLAWEPPQTPPPMTAREIFQCATAYNKIKADQILEALYSNFMSWEKLHDFTPVVRAPDGRRIDLSPDPAMRIGVAHFEGTAVAIVAQHTPPSASQRRAYNYGLTQADGYGLALCMMDYAERYGLSLHTYIDTVGGDPFETSAAKLQSWLIAQCQAKMLSLRTRSIAMIIGQGGSGGAIALQLAHRRYMLARSIYSVIAPEGCAAIVFRQVTEETIAAALAMLQPTAEHLVRYGIIDAIIPEPPLEDPEYLVRTLSHLRQTLMGAAEELSGQTLASLEQQLHDKIAQCGRLAEPAAWDQHVGADAPRRPRAVPQAMTPDPHIAAIRRHAFGDADCVPHACNPVKDADGQVVRPGCGHRLPVEAFRHNWRTCPACGRPDPLDAAAYVDLLLEPGSFQALLPQLSLAQIAGWSAFAHDAAQRSLSAKAQAGSEALVIGHGRLYSDLPVAVAVSNFAYMGGSMGAVVGEKFRAIVDFALAQQLPLLAITATGGARMQEGTVALLQMAKTTAAVLALRRAGLPYIAVLGHPTMGGVLASYATLADFMIAEAKATLAFAGDRVVKLTSQGRGVPPEVMTAEFFARQGGIHAVVQRPAMQALIAGVLRMTPWYTTRQQQQDTARPALPQGAAASAPLVVF